MAPLLILVFSFAILRVIGIWVPHLGDWQHCLRGALGIMFLLTASAHWGKRRPDLMSMVPAAVGNPGAWVTVTGIAEIIIAAGLQLPKMAKAAAVVAIVMLICLFPANVKASREKLTIGGRRVLGAALRGVIQGLFIAALIASL